VPTLAAGDALAACLRALAAQTLERFEVIVIDNSGKNAVEESVAARSASVRIMSVRIIRNATNVGFGAAVNQAWRESTAPFLAALNDDAEPAPEWLAALVSAAEANPRAGMFASCVMLNGSGTLDSAGMSLAADGSSKQRGHGEHPGSFAEKREVLFPSGSAALYRRSMLDQVGMFEEAFFLYCEDTDLGLRARWLGWQCEYVPGARVEHRYSHSTGRASPVKAYYVERNRLYTAIRNFPASMLWMVPFASLTRYFWHVVELFFGRGKAAEYRQAGHDGALLPFLVLRAHVAALFRLPRLWAERRRIFATRRITAKEFRALAAQHSISLRRVAAL